MNITIISICISVITALSCALALVFKGKKEEKKREKLKKEMKEKQEKNWEVVVENEQKKTDVLSGDTVSEFNNIVSELHNISSRRKK